MSKFTTSILQRILFGLILGAALVVGTAAALSFTEPESGPSGFTEPYSATSTGSARDLIGTPNSTATGTDTLFNYLRKIDDSPSAYPEPSASSTGYLSALIGTSSPATANGSTLFKYLKRIDDNVTWGGGGPDYSLQKNRIWDDWDGSASSTSAGLSYAYSNSVDQNEEEATWASTTDTDLNGALVASGVVKKDERTGLYWSDCYDSTSGGGSCNSRGNEFTLNGTIGDADDGLDAEGGQAVDFCEALSLDANGGGDETDWYLPSQKELMQAYINGAANNIPNPDYSFWASTGASASAVCAWSVRLSTGRATGGFPKNTLYNARCVRR